MKRLSPPLAAGALALALALGPGVAGAGETVILLRGLDKVTARVSPIEAAIDVPVRFGSLEITVRTCKKAPPEEPPESAAFLEIREIRAGEAPVKLFSGWMFASSPARSTLDHPVYDVWVIDCAAPAAARASSGE